MELRTNTSQQTKDLGIKTAEKLKPGDVVAFYGDLGSGKTTFIQGVLEGLGIEQRVTSPTFVLIKMYVTPKRQTVFHVDLYRLESNQDIKSLGLVDILQDDNAITLIEWAEKVEDMLPQQVKRIELKKGVGDERIIDADVW